MDFFTPANITSFTAGFAVTLMYLNRRPIVEYFNHLDLLVRLKLSIWQVKHRHAIDRHLKRNPSKRNFKP